MKRTLRYLSLLAVLGGGPVLAETNDYWVPAYAPLDDRGRMKRLDEIEPRTVIDAVPFAITNPGGYYLTRNLTAGTGTVNGITIAADDVNLDLGGFVLTGTTNGWFGISLDSPGNRNIAIRNGSVRGWGRAGVYLADGVNCRLSGVTAFDNGEPASYAGISVGQDWEVEDCVVFENRGTGLYLGSYSRARGCRARANGRDGIRTGQGARLQDCTTVGNTNSGFLCGMWTIINNCSAFENGEDGIGVGSYSLASGNVAHGNQRWGMTMGVGSRVERSLVNNNFGGGIYAGAESRVQENQVVHNLGTGIYGQWSTRIDGNHVSGNNVGLESENVNVAGRASLFVGNTAVGNTTNYITSPNANFGQITTTNMNMLGTNFFMSNPWANFDLQP